MVKSLHPNRASSLRPLVEMRGMVRKLGCYLAPFVRLSSTAKAGMRNCLRMNDPLQNVVVGSPREPFATQGGNASVEQELIGSSADK